MDQVGEGRFKSRDTRIEGRKGKRRCFNAVGTDKGESRSNMFGYTNAFTVAPAAARFALYHATGVEVRATDTLNYFNRWRSRVRFYITAEEEEKEKVEMRGRPKTSSCPPAID